LSGLLEVPRSTATLQLIRIRTVALRTWLMQDQGWACSGTVQSGIEADRRDAINRTRRLQAMRPYWFIAVMLLVPIALRAADGSFIPVALEFNIYVVGTPKKVWDALTVKEQVDLYYMCPQQKFELKPGGSVEYGTPGKPLLSGTVTEIKEGTHLVYSLAMTHGAETKVEVDLEEVSPGVTALELKQSSGA
jgi:hypothetical protein